MTDERDRTEQLERRVASLEEAVRALSTELARQRGERPGGEPHAPDASRSSTSHPMAPRSPLSLPPELQPQNWLPKQIDLESLVGRYGTLVLATVSALAAVGTFLGWAIANGMLGPSQRIALGLIVAAGLGVGGFRLRRRERSFGASLLGLSLAVTHVCAWGAGPSLRLVPEWVAFAVAAAASIALAVFAQMEADEPLWSVGFSGASIAPFVTSSGRSNLFLLAAYGVAVLTAAGQAMGPRRWVIAGRLFLLAVALYTAALATGYERDYGPLLAMAFPLVLAITGVVPWTSGWARRERVRAMGALATVAAVRSGMGMNMPIGTEAVASAIAAAGILWLVLVDRTHHVAALESPSIVRRAHEGDWIDAGVLPLGFVAAAVMALDASARNSGLAMAAAGAVFLLTVMRSPQGTLRDAAVFATVLCVLVALILIERGHTLHFTMFIAGVSVGCFALNLLWRSISWTTLGAIGSAWSIFAALGHLLGRAPYRYTPFATSASGVAAFVLACVAVSAFLARGEQRLGRAMRATTVVWAFLWVHQEIAFAFNQTTATLLRVTYYASTSVAAVWAGRAQRLALLRHVGLALAILAAGTALYGARRLESIAARIGADLVAAVFLMAIAYWYRRPGARGPATALPFPASPSDT